MSVRCGTKRTSGEIADACNMQTVNCRHTRSMPTANRKHTQSQTQRRTWKSMIAMKSQLLPMLLNTFHSPCSLRALISLNSWHTTNEWNTCTCRCAYVRACTGACGWTRDRECLAFNECPLKNKIICEE